jgi:dihydroorotase
MKILVKNGHLIDPASGFDGLADISIEAGKVTAVGQIAPGFVPQKTIDAAHCVVSPGLVDLAVRLREPGDEHAGMLESEMRAAVAGGVTSLVCPPDTDPVLDEPGLVRMLKFKAEKLHLARVFPLGALTLGLRGESLTEMAQLAKAGCVGFSQADVPVLNTQFLLRAFQYASTFGLTIWLRPSDPFLGTGVAASGAMATRLGLSGSPVMAETIALHTFIQLARSTQCRLHVCRISSAEGVAMVRRAKADGVAVTCDVSINSLHLTDIDIGFFDSRARLNPPLRQSRDREALQQGLLDGTIDALVSDHTPLPMDAKDVPFASATPGASGVELLLSLALKWATYNHQTTGAALARITTGPAAILAAGAPFEAALGRVAVGGLADLCVFKPDQAWRVDDGSLQSQGKSTPFSGYELIGQVQATLVAGQIAFERTH